MPTALEPFKQVEGEVIDGLSSVDIRRVSAAFAEERNLVLPSGISPNRRSFDFDCSRILTRAFIGFSHNHIKQEIRELAAGLLECYLALVVIKIV